jgi:hypothetical protein
MAEQFASNEAELSETGTATTNIFDTSGTPYLDKSNFF